MDKFNAILRFLGDLFSSDAGLSPEIQRYCREENVDPWALRQDATRFVRPSEQQALPRSQVASLPLLREETTRQSG